MVSSTTCRRVAAFAACAVGARHVRPGRTGRRGARDPDQDRARRPAPRVAHGVYLVGGAPTADHLDLRAAWLQLAPQVPAWERTADQGVVSHRSAAAIYGIGGLCPDRHEFLVPGAPAVPPPRCRCFEWGGRRARSWWGLGGLLVTRPARIASDLLVARADPEEVGQVIAGALQGALEYRVGVRQAARTPRGTSRPQEGRRVGGVASAPGPERRTGFAGRPRLVTSGTCQTRGRGARSALRSSP